MKGLRQVKIRRQYDAYEQTCSICRFLRRAEHNLQSLKNRRAHLFRES